MIEHTMQKTVQIHSTLQTGASQGMCLLDHSLARLVKSGKVRAAHDPSEGGLAVALAEMAFASEHGVAVDVADIPGDTSAPAQQLFSESASRYVLEIDRKQAKAIEATLAKSGVPFARIGQVVPEGRVVIRSGGMRGTTLVDVSTKRLVDAWRNALPVMEESAR